MEQIRRLLAERGACEVPQYPEPLASVWYHPDMLLAARGGGTRNCFCFQTMWQRGTGAAAVGVSCMPALVWLMDCSEHNFTAAVVDFISDLHFAITSSREDSGFSLVADAGITACRSERGCCWKLHYNGVSCGHISLYSELFFRSLEHSAVILVLDLAKLPGLLNQKNPGLPVFWAEKLRAADLLALRAWQLKCPTVTGDLLQQQADKGLELCRLISLLNSESLVPANDEFQLKKLLVSIDEAVQHLLGERVESGAKGRDDDK
jgi:hypothetical protein